MKYPLRKILYNRYLLYFILVISIVNMITVSLKGDYMTPVVFILVGTVVSYFNKNMLVILTIALVASNLLKYGKKMIIKEGFSGEESDSKPPSSDDEETGAGTGAGEKDKDMDVNIKKTKETFTEFMNKQDKITANMNSLTTDLNDALKILDQMQNTILNQSKDKNNDKNK